MNALYFLLMLCGSGLDPSSCRRFDDGPAQFRTLALCEAAADEINGDTWRNLGPDQKTSFAQCFESPDGSAWRQAKRVSAPFIAPGARTTIMPDIVPFLTRVKNDKCPALGSACERIDLVLSRNGLSVEERECVLHSARSVPPEFRTRLFWDNDTLFFYLLTATTCVR